MWVIQVPPPFIIQIHVLNLAVEGPSPCLFDWLEVQEQMALSSVVIRSVMFNLWADKTEGKNVQTLKCIFFLFFSLL